MENTYYRRFAYFIILTLGLVWIYWSSPPAETVNYKSISAPQAGFLSPDFTLNTLDGQTVTLSQLRGKPVIINFWASWCPPCREEMLGLENVFQDFKDKGLIILAVNSTIQDSRKNASDFVKQNGLTFPVLLDEDGKVTELYQIQSLPTTFFVNADGSVDEIVIGGPVAEALLHIRIQQLMEYGR